jgi:hypothetical protein
MVAIQDVVVGFSGEHIAAEFTFQQVITEPAQQDIIIVTSAKDIVATVAEDPVTARAPLCDVGTIVRSM